MAEQKWEKDNQNNIKLFQIIVQSNSIKNSVILPQSKTTHISKE